MNDGGFFRYPPPEPRAGPTGRSDYVQHLYTVTPNSAPPSGVLTVGEFGIELADPAKLWVGVPTSMDVTGRKLLFDSSLIGGAAFPEAPIDGVIYGRQGSTKSWLGVLPLTGGTLTGPLTIASPSDASINIHATGPSWPAVVWNTDLAGTAAGYFESRRYGLSRWSVEFGGTGREAGYNAGTDFLINRFDDAGHVIYPSPLAINRADGSVTFGALVWLATDPTADMMAATKHYVDSLSPVGLYLPLTGGTINPGPLNIEQQVDNPRLNLTGLTGIGSYQPIVTLNTQAATGGIGLIRSQRNGALRWSIALGDGLTPEALGTNAGTDLVIASYDDFGGLLRNVLTIARGTGATKIAGDLNVLGAVTLSAGDPTFALQAATKQYVDAQTGSFLPLSGGILTGPLIINPTSSTFAGLFGTDKALLTQVWTTGTASTKVGTYIASIGGGEPSLVGIAGQGSLASPVQPLYTQVLLGIAGRAWDGVTWSNDQAAITLRTNEQWSATGHGTFILFMVTPRGSVTRNPAMLLNGSGALLIGTNDPGQDNLTDKLQVFGSATFAGSVTLQYYPTTATQAASKQYVDDQATTIKGAYVAKAGDTMSGTLTINAPGNWTSYNYSQSIVLGGNGQKSTLTFMPATDGTKVLTLLRYGDGLYLSSMPALNGTGSAEIDILSAGEDYFELYADATFAGSLDVFGALSAYVNPTSGSMVGSRNYNDARYLQKTGGTMTGGIVFANVYGQSNADATHHLILYSGFGFGVTANRMNYIAGATGTHAFINSVDTALISNTGLAMQGATDITLARVPTGAMMAVPKSYADLMLPLAGGTMLGGIAFADTTSAGPSDLSKHIRLHSAGGGYGFSVTGGRLNIATGGSTWFSDSPSGLDIAYFYPNGLAFVGLTTATLGRDPTANMEAATKQYADSRITAAGGPFLPISAGVSKPLTGMLYLPHTTPTIDEMATPKFYVDTQDLSLQLQINQLTQNLLFVGQCHVPEDSTLFTAASGITPSPGPLPAAEEKYKGYYVIVTGPGRPPVGSNIPMPPGSGVYTEHDWIICDGTVWVHLMLGLVYFTADQIAVLPQIVSGATQVQSTLQWLFDNKLNLAGGTMQGQLLLQTDPTSNMMAATRQYVDTKAGNYLPLLGGTMQGGISFGSAAQVSNSDTSRHLTLHVAGYGFGITPFRLNYNVPSTAYHVMLVAGVDVATISGTGIAMNSGAITLLTDPTAVMHATTKQYVDGRTPLAVDAPNNGYSYGRNSAAWSRVESLNFVGAGAFDLNSVPAGFIGTYQITNQTSAANWPADIFAQCGYLIAGYNSTTAWANQLLMGPPSNATTDASIFYRNQYNGTWSPWWRIITAAGGRMTGLLTINTPGNFDSGQYNLGLTIGSSSAFSPALLFSNYTPASFLISMYGRGLYFSTATATGWTADLVSFEPTVVSIYVAAAFSNTVLLNRDPTANLQAATKQYVDAVRTLVTGSYLPLAGGTLTGNLQANTQVWVGTATGNGGAVLVAQGAPTKAPGLSFFTNFQRWFIALDQAPESGSNAGGNLAFYRYADNGGFLGTSLSFNRADGSASFGYKVFLANDPTSGLEAATKAYVDNRAASGVTSFNTRTGAVTLTSADVTNALTYTPVNRAGDFVYGPLIFQVTPTTTTAQLVVGPSGAGNNLEGKLRFYGTFGAGIPDLGPRFTASLRSGYAGSSAWGGEYLDVWMANGNPNDATSDVQQVQVLRFLRNGINMPANMHVYLASDPTSPLEAATMQYADGVITRAGGPFLPLTGGTLSGFVTTNNIINFAANSSTVAGTWGLQITNNISQGAGETDFVNCWAAAGGFDFYQLLSGNVLRRLVNIRWDGMLSLWGLGIVYNGVTHGGNIVGFSWYGGWLNAFVDGNFIGFLMTSSAADSLYLKLSGGTLTGDLVVGGQLSANGANPQINVNGAAGTWRTIQFYSGGLARWNIQLDPNPESGGNVGSDIFFTRWTDAGAPIDNPLKISRATGKVTIAPGNYNDPLEIIASPGYYARYTSTVTGARSWCFGARADGIFTIADNTAGLDRFFIDTSGNMTAFSNLTVNGSLFVAVVGNPFTLQSGDSSAAHNLTQIALCYQGTNQFRHWITTRHYGGPSSQRFGNAIDFWLCDGVGPGSFPTNAFWGGAFSAYGLSLPVGTAANPSLNFGNQDSGAGDWNTGLYDAGAAIGFSTAGVNRATINANGLTAIQVTGTATGGGMSAGVRVVAAGNATYAWNETGAAANARKWDAIAGGGTLYFRALSDDESVGNSWLWATRNGATLTGISFGAQITSPVAINCATASWGAFNYGSQLLIRGPQNNSIGIADNSGGNWLAITNNGGVLRFQAMPAPTDSTTVPIFLLGLATTGANFSVALTLNGDPTAALHAATKQYCDNKFALAVGGGYVAKSGDTMTGNLTINVSGTHSLLSLNRSAGYLGSILGNNANGQPRWRVDVVDNGTETGGNAGSNFAIQRYDDGGGYLGNSFNINRANGNATFSNALSVLGTLGVIGTVTAGGGGGGTLQLNPGGGSNTGYVSFFDPAGARRAYFGFGSGANFSLNLENGTTTLQLSGALTVSGNCHVNSQLWVDGGVIYWSGRSDIYHYFDGSNLVYAGPGHYFYGGITSTGTFTATSGRIASVGNANNPSFGVWQQGGNYPIACAFWIDTSGYAWQYGQSQADSTPYSGWGYLTNAAHGFSGGTVTTACNSGAYSAWWGTYHDFNVPYVAWKPGGGVWADSSDARIKDVLGEYDQGLDAVVKLRPVRYRFKNNWRYHRRRGAQDNYAGGRAASEQTRQPHKIAALEGTIFVGLVAQEVEGVMPEMVGRIEGELDEIEVDDIRTLDTSALPYAIVNAIKELVAMNTALASRVEALERLVT